MDLRKHIPSVEKLLSCDEFKTYNKYILKNIINTYLSNLRTEIFVSGKCDYSFLDIVNFIDKEYKNITANTLKPIVNATGVVLHTNLGRSIFNMDLINEIIPILTSYSNLEYDIDSKTRGDRYNHISDMLKVLFNVEDALIVNNNAAAVFLILHTFAKNKEVIISRGELVEIGGSFRIPEIMSSSNAVLKEIGTTNKTNILDYKNAINENSALIMKVHKSNYDITGFTSEVDISDITNICKQYNLIDYYDLGSGYYGGINCNEPSILNIIKNPPSLLSFSGDKLFGSAQAGIILGKKELIKKLKKNHILRMLRVDKITIAILQATIKHYINNNFDAIPTLKMLRTSNDELLNIANKMIINIPTFFNPTILKINSLAGGGSLPNTQFISVGIALFTKLLSTNLLENNLRQQGIIARILDSKVIFDMRTLKESDINLIIKVLRDIAKDYDG